jgi:hypothetical protein
VKAVHGTDSSRKPAMERIAFAIAALIATACPALADETGFSLPRGFSCPANAIAMARLELYFGLSRPNGVVTDVEWDAFVANEVTPRFPDGLTILSGYGQWRNSAQAIVREASRVLVILYAPAPDAETRIEEIRIAYKIAFQQESVMRIDSASCVSF